MLLLMLCVAGGGDGDVYVLWYIKLMIQIGIKLYTATATHCKWYSFTIEWKCDGKIIYQNKTKTK